MIYIYIAPSNGHGLFWYSFQVGLVHVIQMSSEHDFLPTSKQYAWLATELAAVNRTLTPWIVFTAHRMMVYIYIYIYIYISNEQGKLDRCGQ